MIKKIIIAGALMLAIQPSFAEEIRKADLDQFLIVQDRVAPVVDKWQKQINAAPEQEKDALRVQAFRDIESTIKRGGMKPEQYFAMAKVITERSRVKAQER